MFNAGMSTRAVACDWNIHFSTISCLQKHSRELGSSTFNHTSPGPPYPASSISSETSHQDIYYNNGFAWLKNLCTNCQKLSQGSSCACSSSSLGSFIFLFSVCVYILCMYCIKCFQLFIFLFFNLSYISTAYFQICVLWSNNSPRLPMSFQDKSCHAQHDFTIPLQWYQLIWRSLAQLWFCFISFCGIKAMSVAQDFHFVIPSECCCCHFGTKRSVFVLVRPVYQPPTGAVAKKEQETFSVKLSDVLYTTKKLRYHLKDH